MLSTDTQTAFIYRYLDPETSDINSISSGIDLTSIAKKNPAIYNGSLILRSIRQEIVSLSARNIGLHFWKGVDTVLDGSHKKVYDNGYSRLYFRHDE